MSGQEDRLKAVEPETANCGQQQRHDTLTKSERVCSRNTVEQLFGGGQSRAMSAFPIRMVYMITDRQEGEPAAQMLVSVPKRCFKRAVKRNRVKRQVREAYRHLKHGVIEAMTARQEGGHGVHLHRQQSAPYGPHCTENAEPPLTSGGTHQRQGTGSRTF